VEEELTQWCEDYVALLRGAHVAPTARARDTVLAFVVAFVAPLLATPLRHAWLDAERRLIVRTAPETNNLVRPSLEQWLLTGANTAPDEPMNAVLALAADHTLALASVVPPIERAPAPPENLQRLAERMARVLSDLAPRAPPPRKGPRRALPVYKGDAPDLEDLVTHHLPPCIARLQALDKKKNTGRRVMASFLAAIGYRDPADVPRLSAFVQRTGESVAEFGGRLTKAMALEGQQEFGCWKMYYDPELRDELGGCSACPETLKGDGRLCAHTAGFEPGSTVSRPSDFVLLSRTRVKN